MIDLANAGVQPDDPNEMTLMDVVIALGEHGITVIQTDGEEVAAYGPPNVEIPEWLTWQVKRVKSDLLRYIHKVPKLNKTTKDKETIP